MKTKFQDFSRIIPGLFSVFKDSISLTVSQFFNVFAGNGDSKQVPLHFYHQNIFIMVLINTGTTGKLNQSTVPPSLFHTVFFRASHKSKRMEKNRCILLFSRTISYFKGNFTKFQDNSRTNGTILKFQEFSRTNVKFKDFSRSVGTLNKAHLLAVCFHFHKY